MWLPAAAPRLGWARPRRYIDYQAAAVRGNIHQPDYRLAPATLATTADTYCLLLNLAHIAAARCSYTLHDVTIAIDIDSIAPILLPYMGFACFASPPR